MPHTNTEADEPRSPLIVVDDDQWVYVYSSAEDLARAVEPALLDDIVDVFDGSARPLRITWAEDSIQVVIADEAPHLHRLQKHMDCFFRAWTTNAPPPHAAKAEEYIPRVLKAYALRNELRHKSKRPRKTE
ncbi:hypothetical protein QWJ26_27400 [Streptomyces sp. CSDS2]|uniref:hypothetical protein n=1 Tax=Streptomyces sp. CSDS2 TaxID=3055051 RepID=UPI0025AF584B|nr:hypothetical protein [Streptomyces sp. CSDS2]MDN3263472.1 hypothetical protein [Streptomyces sp. CSDS2]